MKNSKGISLIALIITIIVIIILAAIVIGGVFNTPNDAKFANFCQQYDELQTQIRLKYYELYQDDALNSINNTTVKNVYELYNQVATGTFTNQTADAWVAINFTNSGLPNPSLGADGWFLRLSDGKLAYKGFQKDTNEYYYTPSVYGNTANISGNVAGATTLPTGSAFAVSNTALTASSTPAPAAPTPTPTV